MSIEQVTQQVHLAQTRIRPYVRETILEHSPVLSRLGKAQVFCKLENLQHTGSFKFRGAMNKLLSLTETERRQGVVTASTGNHGAAVAFGLSRFESTPGIIFVPHHASPNKVTAIKQLGADVRPFGNDCIETELHARHYAAQHHMAYIPPYNDWQIIGGQRTIGVELARQLEHLDAVFVSMGGGGLISGIAGYLKSRFSHIQVIGCSPENSQVMVESVRAGQILDLPSAPTLSDGTAGGLEPGAITFELCRTLVDDFVTVSEADIILSLRLFMQSHHMMIEGAAAVAVAAYLKVHERFRGKNVVIIICGANISLETLKTIL